MAAAGAENSSSGDRAGRAASTALCFTVLNGLGALVWAVALGAAGFLLGEGLELFLEDLAAHERWIFASILALGILGWSIRRMARR